MSSNTIEFYIENAEKDLLIDETTIIKSSISISRLKIRWLQYIYEEKNLLSEIQGKYNSLYKVVYKKIRENSQLQLEKRDLEKAIIADPDMNKARMVLDKQIHIVEFLESVIKTFDGFSYNVHNAIEYIKFQNGE